MKAFWLALLCAVWVSWPVAAPAGAPDLAALCADRLATEKVYYEHRLGAKPPFAQTMPAELVSSLVESDLNKETLLRRAYGLSVTDGMVQAEVERINHTTRAPEVLLELKQALRAQLRQPGDVSALIDMPSAFVVYVLKRRSEAAMTIAGISLAKRSFDDWLAREIAMLQCHPK